MDRMDVLRLALMQAAERGYQGRGCDLWRSSSDDLARTIQFGDHLPALRSAEFARCLFQPRLHAQVCAGGPLVVQNWEELERQAMSRQEALKAAADPLEFLVASMGQWLH